MTGIPIGRLNKRIEIERPIHESDGAGGLTTTGWLGVASVNARIAPVGLREQIVSGRLDGVATHRITLRQGTEIEAGMRITFGERVFQVLTVQDPDESGRYLLAVCEEEGL